MAVCTPAYRLHKQSGQAVVRRSGRDFYLFEHGAPESRAEYDRIVGEWLVWRPINCMGSVGHSGTLRD
jgi:hypothetical protein